MGSKKSMLKNGLGELLTELAPSKDRFFDLFCGSGSVAGYVAQNFDTTVHAGDLQRYAVTLAASQIQRTTELDTNTVSIAWMADAEAWLNTHSTQWKKANKLTPYNRGLASWRAFVRRTRDFCDDLPEDFYISRAYGGHYYSSVQSMVIDALRATLPKAHKIDALAALIDASSSCAAAPGHTAQPFGTNDSALPHLARSWARDISTQTSLALKKIGGQTANVKGHAVQMDALKLAGQLTDGDLAFIDPPYSEVQYSRFYHVLETIAAGTIASVSGIGRYPPIEDRPQSQFCRVTESQDAFEALMQKVASTGAEAIVTFPSEDASNGLSGKVVEKISKKHFRVKSKKISSLFSTMGGNSVTRSARHATFELVLHLAPKT